MTPVHLNPPLSPFPFMELKEEQQQQQHLQLFLSPQQAAAAASSSSALSTAADHPIFSNMCQDQRVVLTKLEESKPYDHKVLNMYMSTTTHDNGSSNQQASSTLSSLQSAPWVDHSTVDGHNSSFSRKDQDGDYEGASDNINGYSSVKWMPSKMRIMKKMMNNSNSTTGSLPADHHKPAKFQSWIRDNNSTDQTYSSSKPNNSIRVCSDCNTTTTPLWRSGPRGPKSLCNACGIRQRKARRAMEAAAAAAAAASANGATTATSDATSMKIKVHINKEKKSRSTSHIAQYKKQFKPTSDHNSPHHGQNKKLCFKEFALSLSNNSALQRVFPQDVEDAAILLMELSCGLVHS